MSALQLFFHSFRSYTGSTQELRKFNELSKRNSKTRQGDLSTFCSFECNGEVLESELNNLLNESKKWKVQVISYQILKNRIFINLLRTNVIKSIFTEVSQRQSSYGITNLFNGRTYRVRCADCRSLTRLRMARAAQVISALIAVGGGSVANTDSQQDDEVETVYLSHAVNTSQSVLVGHVKVTSDVKSEEDLIRLRTADMLAMSDHKNIDEKSLHQLVDASINFDLLSVKLEKPMCLELSSQSKASRQSNCKGAPFVLYNYARLHGILERHDHGVATGVYPPLCSVGDVDCSLLSSQDEWSLVYDLLAEWPSVIAECQDLSQPPLHRLVGFLSALAAAFSVYYRHTRVLTEGLAHMIPLLEARIHLLKTIKVVFLIAFNLLRIVPPTSM